jgi:hypothetical protein
LHAWVVSIQRGVITWCATSAKVVKMYPKHHNAGLNIFITVKVINEEVTSIIMVIS